VQYVEEVIALVSAEHSIDPDRVYVLGHSNGAAMAYRVACERADLFAAAVPVEGSPPSPVYGCEPGEPVPVLHVHGTADTTVLYEGDGSYLGAVGSLELWAGYNGCGEAIGDGGVGLGTLDLSAGVAGDETEVFAACEGQREVRLWKMNGEDHGPNLGDGWAEEVVQWMMTKSKGGGEAGGGTDAPTGSPTGTPTGSPTGTPTGSPTLAPTAQEEELLGDSAGSAAVLGRRLLVAVGLVVAGVL
jgi:polyhydroxybutyrate depolymerase